MTIEESIKQLINDQLIEQFGKDYKSFRSYIEKVNETNRSNSNEINKIKSDIKAYSDINEKIKEFEQKIGKISGLETLFKMLNDKQSSFVQQTSNKITDLEFTNKDISQNVIALLSKNRELSQRITDLEAKITNMEKKYQNLQKENNINLQGFSAGETKSREPAPKNNVSPGTVRETSRNEELFDHSDNIIISFNNWASHPSSMLPGEFTYVNGDFRIRTNQQELMETREKTKWIINRGGTKTYLLPNPIFFDQMTNLDLYEMDLSMLKEKGKNKIKIITPCEISSSGFIEFKGKLQIIN